MKKFLVFIAIFIACFISNYTYGYENLKNEKDEIWDIIYTKEFEEIYLKTLKNGKYITWIRNLYNRICYMEFYSHEKKEYIYLNICPYPMVDSVENSLHLFYDLDRKRIFGILILTDTSYPALITSKKNNHFYFYEIDKYKKNEKYLSPFMENEITYVAYIGNPSKKEKNILKNLLFSLYGENINEFFKVKLDSIAPKTKKCQILKKIKFKRIFFKNHKDLIKIKNLQEKQLLEKVIDFSLKYDDILNIHQMLYSIEKIKNNREALIFSPYCDRLLGCDFYIYLPTEERTVYLTNVPISDVDNIFISKNETKGFKDFIFSGGKVYKYKNKEGYIYIEDCFIESLVEEEN